MTQRGHENCPKSPSKMITGHASEFTFFLLRKRRAAVTTEVRTNIYTGPHVCVGWRLGLKI